VIAGAFGAQVQVGMKRVLMPRPGWRPDYSTTSIFSMSTSVSGTFLWPARVPSVRP